MRKYKNAIPGETRERSRAVYEGTEKLAEIDDELLAYMKLYGQRLERIEALLSSASIQRMEKKAVEGQTIEIPAGIRTALVINNGTYPIGVQIVGYQSTIMVGVFGSRTADGHIVEFDVEGYRGMIIHHGANVMSENQIEIYDANNPAPDKHKEAGINATVVLSNRRRG